MPRPTPPAARITPSALFDGLNDRQLEAVAAPDGALLVIAGPGSGKTRVICTRVAHLVRDRSVDPRSIAALTFTRKAAGEMKERVHALLDPSDTRAVWISTFHRLCGAILREDGQAIGIPAHYRIIDGADRIALMRDCMFEQRVDSRVTRTKPLLHEISVLKNTMHAVTDPRHYGDGEDAQIKSRLAGMYQSALRARNALDFDDMLLAAVRLLHDMPDVRKRWAERFPYILIDEYQDTNLPQYILLRKLAEGHNNVFAVGDPDQAIYGWRGAELQNILSFHQDFPEARRIDLELSYRSTGRILDAAAALIAANRLRLQRRLRCANPPGRPVTAHRVADAAAEAAYAVERARARILRDGGTVAVLYRTNAQSRALESAFKHAGIPYRLASGESFYERPEILDVLCCLQVSSDPADDDAALARFLDLPPLPRIGRATLDRITGHAAGDRRASFWERLQAAAEAGILPHNKIANIRERILLIEHLRPLVSRLPFHDLVDTVLHETRYRTALAASGDVDVHERLDNIAELVSDAHLFETRRRQTLAPQDCPALLGAFIAHCRSMTAATDPLASRDARVTLSTLHGAKGLEFDTVVITGFDADRLPHRRTVKAADDASQALEEERRLAYVGMTRARLELVLTIPATSGHGEDRRATAPSPFIKDIPPDLLQATSAAPAPAAIGLPSVALSGDALTEWDMRSE